MRKRIKLSHATTPTGTPESTTKSQTTTVNPVPEVAATMKDAIIPLDPRGDLILHVGTMFVMSKPHAFKVCSHTLRRASPVWMSMLSGKWSEAKPAQGNWIVELPEDQPWATEILLSILHGVFEKVPRTVSLSSLYNILTLADKYDMMHVIQPWAEPWAATIKNFNPTRLTGLDQIMRVHTAWELGMESPVSEGIIDLAYNISWIGEHSFYKSLKLEFDGHCGPPDLKGKPAEPFLSFNTWPSLLDRTLTQEVEIISELRLSLIQTFLDFHHAEIEARMCLFPICTRGVVPCSTGNAELCASVILGGIWRSLRHINQDLPKEATQYSGSVKTLMRLLSTMFDRLPYLPGHKSCCPADKFAKLKADTKQDDRYQNVLRTHHKERMAGQRKKIGLSPEGETV